MFYFVLRDDLFYPAGRMFSSRERNISVLRNEYLYAAEQTHFFVKMDKQNKYYILFLPNKTRFRVQKVQRFTMTLF
ncbi:hypothetical protein HMPREF9445_03165 [Bacteroides clarus YIT 12056]|uniref:Uncharacterized protein n=1 Tax=Bacteroides clarus YIT 12056 TaxID=762984 RepID=A0ABN0CKQ6_9BACE|nr:hypothetical protein HMPREF9445_03165 [Bacteroides clarus YIT 12056]